MTTEQAGRLASLETKMDVIIGNGQGRLDRIERSVSIQQRVIWTAAGVVGTLQVLHANGLLRWFGK
jgi:hypothetical protein